MSLLTVSRSLREGQDHRGRVVKARQIPGIQRNLAVGFKAGQRHPSQLGVDAGDGGLELVLEDEVATDAVEDHRPGERNATDLRQGSTGCLASAVNLAGALSVMRMTLPSGMPQAKPIE